MEEERRGEGMMEEGRRVGKLITEKTAAGVEDEGDEAACCAVL